MRKNVASQTVCFQAVSTTDGSAVTTGTPSVYYTIDGGTQGTGSGSCVHEGNGCWSYTPAQAETNGNNIAFTFVLSGAVSQTVNIYTVSYDPHDTVRLGLTALPNAAADAAGGLPISDAGGLDLDNRTLGATAVSRLNLSAGQIITGTVDTATNGHTPTTTEFQADDITEATADHYNGRVVIFTSGALNGQATDITDYAAVGGIGQFTVTALTEAPANNDTFIIV